MKRLARFLLPLLAVTSLSACHSLHPETITVCNRATGGAHHCWEIQP